MSSSQWIVNSNFFDCLLECVSFLQCADQDVHMGKDDVVSSMRSRIHFMVGKVLSHGVCTSMSMRGWGMESSDPIMFADRESVVPSKQYVRPTNPMRHIRKRMQLSKERHRKTAVSRPTA